MVVGTIVLKFDLEEIVGKAGISVDATTKKNILPRLHKQDNKERHENLPL